MTEDLIKLSDLIFFGYHGTEESERSLGQRFIIDIVIKMDLKKYIRSIPDYPKKGILFRDITTLIKDENAFKSCIDKIVEISKKINFDKIAAIESRGFIFSSPLSYIVNKPIVLLRKENKLPSNKYSVDFKLEYGISKLEVHKDSIKKNEKILIIDDLIATGGTANAAVQLVELSGGKVSGFIFVINLFDLGGQDKLKKKSYFTQSLINFPGH